MGIQSDQLLRFPGLGRGRLRIARILSLLWLSILVLFTTLAQADHVLTQAHEHILSVWLSTHLQYRVATDADCRCPEDIAHIRVGYGGVWRPVPGYHPYAATGDFNGDGVVDFAAVVVEKRGGGHPFAIVVFNGPFAEKTVQPAFFRSGLDLEGQGLFYGPPRPRPYRLVLGPFEAEGSALVPQGNTYKPGGS